MHHRTLRCDRRAATAGLSYFNSQDLANTVCAFATAGRTPPVLFDEIVHGGQKFTWKIRAWQTQRELSTAGHTQSVLSMRSPRTAIIAWQT
eukprot:10132067-Karenia_brevis.AAC.1